MKQKKLKQWLTVALSLALLGLGLSIGINADKLNAKPSLKKTFSEKAMVGDPADWPKLGTGNGTFGNPVEDAEPWLPYYKPGLGIGGGGWLDSIQSYIPKGSSFAMMYLPGKTAVGDKVGIDYSAGFTIPRDENGKLKPGNATFLTGKDRVEWIKVANVGYYQGRFVDVKVTIKTQEAGRDEKYPAFLQLDDSSAFMTIRMDHYSKAMDISYEFFYSDGTPLNGMQLYWDKFSDDISYTVIDQSLIKNVYSVSREYKVGELSLPTHLIYQNPAPNEFVLRSSGIDTAASYQHNRVRSRATFSYLNPRGKFEFKYVSTVEPREAAGAQIFSYSYDTLVKIEIPDPMEQSQVYPEIIGQNQGILKNESENKVEKLHYGFVQHMPWESKIDTLEINNRTQKPSWELNPIGTTSAVTTSEWEVVPQDLTEGTNSTEMFDTSGVDESGKGIIKPKESELVEDEFYNHYYKFNRSLNIDYNNPIARTSLKAKDGRYYFDYSGKVNLAVNDTNPTPEQKAGMNKNPEEEVKYDTAINFYAPLEYKYVNSVTGDEIPAGSLPTSGDGIVTWDAPLTPRSLTDATYTEATGKGSAPVIPGYTFKEAKLNDGDDFQVKVTKLLKDGGDAKKAEDYTQNNVVTLEYQPLYTVDVQVGALDTDGNFGMIPFAPPSGTSAPYVTVQETTAPTTPENAISPTDPDADAEFTFPTTYDFEVGTGKSYQVTQTENVNNDYTKPNQATSPVFSINDQNQLVVDGNVVNDLPYKDGDFILSWDAINKKLTIQIINFPNGDVEIEGVEIGGEYRVDDIDFGNITIPATSTITKAPEAKNDQYPSLVVKDTRLPNYREAGWTLYVQMTKPFRLKTGENAFDENETIHDILKYKGNFDFIKDGENEEPTELDIPEGGKIPIESLIPTDGETKVDLGAQEASKGFYLEIDKLTQLGIKAGEYQAELTFSVENSAFTTSSGRSK